MPDLTAFYNFIRDHADGQKDSVDQRADALKNFLEKVTDDNELLQLQVDSLRAKRDELMADIERISKERDDAKQRHAELVEVTALRTDQNAKGA